MTDEAVTIGLDDDRIKFFADRLLEVARIKAATEPYEGECDREDLASYAGEVVKLRRALLDARAKPAQVDWEALLIAAKRMSSDYQTSVTHHPKHVLVRREDFDALIAAAQEGRE